jgi:polyhydroxyalkanoate synthase
VLLVARRAGQPVLRVGIPAPAGHPDDREAAPRLRRPAMHNRLARPGGVTVLGREINLRQVAVDSYVVAGSAHPICPWQACHRSAQLLGGTVRFVPSTNGHIAALLNPPGNPRSSYRVSADIPPEAADWAPLPATEKDSWWPDLAGWRGERSGEQKPAPAELGNERFGLIEGAPSSYVRDTWPDPCWAQPPSRRAL